MYDWNKRANHHIHVIPETDYDFAYNLPIDECLFEVCEPIDGGTDMRRESLRRNAKGQLYLHTDNDREKEFIYTNKAECKAWATAYNICITKFDNSKVSALRKDRGLTQQALADACGVGIRNVQRVEGGEVDIHRIEFAFGLALAKALGVRPEDLL